jgi:membrane-associated phospholipid phosphatase
VRLRLLAPAIWLALSAVMAATVGVPTSHDLVFAWLASGMAAVSLTSIHRRLPRFVLEWLPFMGVLFVYDRLRGIADGLLFRVHTAPQIRADAKLFGAVPTVWLQQHLWHGGAHIQWWDYAAWFVYVTHFFGTLFVAGALWLWWHDRFARFATMVCVLALTGFATYVLYPAAPPWMAAQGGEIGRANRIVAVVWPHVPLAHYGSLFEKGQHYANNVAAMPSLHAGYALLITLYLWRLVRPRWRVLLAFYPPAMAFALVYTGEHYAIDVLAGWVYATVAYLAVTWLFERRRVPVPEPEYEPVYAD